MRRVLTVLTPLALTFVALLMLFTFYNTAASTTVSTTTIAAPQTAVSIQTNDSSPSTSAKIPNNPPTSPPDYLTARMQNNPTPLSFNEDDAVAAYNRSHPSRPEAVVENVYAPSYTPRLSPAPPPPRSPSPPPPRFPAPLRPLFTTAPTVVSGLFTATLQPLHRNNYNSGLSSAFVFTNTGATSAEYFLHFYWLNGQYIGSDNPLNLSAGASHNYDMDSTGAFGESTYVGYVEITGDEPLSAAITTPDYGMVSGMVFEDDGVTPLMVQNLNLNRWSDQQWIGDSYSMGDGRFYLGGLPDDDYRLWIHPSYPWAAQWYGDHLDWNDADHLIISGAGTISVSVTLQPGGRVSGTVYADDGVTPLANINVDTEPGGLGTCTDGNGRFHMQGLPYGDYRIQAGGGWNWCQDQQSLYVREYYSETYDYETAVIFTLDGSTDTYTDVDFTLDLGGFITGIVYAEDGITPLENINVDVERGNFGTCTNANGEYTISGLYYDLYKVRAGGGWNWCLDHDSEYVTEYYSETNDVNAATLIDIWSNITVTDINFTLAEGGKITGRVTDGSTGLPLANARVNADEYDNNDFGSGVHTDANGYYTITGLIDADYRIAVNDIPPGYARQYYDQQQAHHMADRVTLSGGGTISAIDFPLGPGGIITGYVVDENSGLPIPDMNLSVHMDDWGDGSCTEADGYYEFRAIPYGDYRVSAGGDWNHCQDQPSQYVREYYDNTPNWDDAVILTLDGSSDPIADINFTLGRGGYIAGNVQDDTAANVPDLRMVAIVGSGDCPWCREEVAAVATDAGGNYVLGPLPDGEYVVYACTDCTGQLLVSEYFNDVYDMTDATRITVTNDVTVTGINMVLDPGVWLNGHVDVPSGYSNEGIQVDVWKIDGFWFGSNRQTDASGNYIIPVPPSFDSYWGVAARPYDTDLGFQWAHQFDLAQHSNWDFALDVGGTITGCITDGGVPISDLWVTADSPWMNEGDQTDANGCYAISNLPPAEYEVRADDWGSGYMWTSYGGHDWDWLTRIPLELGETIADISFNVPLRGQIEGYIYESDGATPIEGIRVAAMNENGYWWGYSQPDGYFTIDVPVGEHKLRFDNDDFWMTIPAYYPDSGTHTWAAATPVWVDPLPLTAYITMELERPSELSGQITDADTGDPVGGIHVVAQNADPAVNREVARWNDCTDEFGNYFIDRIWPGDTLITAVGTCGAWDYGTVTGTLTVVSGDSHTLDLTMIAGTAPEAPFTIRTNEGFDYTPFSSGNNMDWQEAEQILPALFAPLAQMDDQGDWYSELLVQIPTLANGGAAIVNDQLVVTYELLPGLLWSDGAPLTSDDIRFAWEMLSQPHPLYDGYLAQVGLLNKIDEVLTPDPLTAVFIYQPRFFPPGYLGALTYLLPEHILAGEHPIDIRWQSDFAHFPVGNGPYMVVDWVPGSHLDLVANPNYHKRGAGLPIIPEVRFLFTNDPFWTLVNGQAQVSINLNWELPPDFDTFGLTVHENLDPVFWQIMPNNETVFFEDADVRRALYHALNRPLIAEMNGFNNVPADSWLQPNHPLYSDTITTYNYDLGTAAAMLTAAGWVDSNGDGIRDKGGVEFEFDLYTIEGSTSFQNMAVTFQNDLASIGVDANIIARPWDHDTYFDPAGRGEFDAFVLGWGFDDRYDPNGYYLFHGLNIPTGYNSYQGSLYNGRWSDPFNDATLLATRTELDETTLKNLYADQLANITDQMPAWPVTHRYRYDIATPTLLNFQPAAHTPVTWNMEEWELPANPYDLVAHKTLALDSPAPMPGATIIYEVRIQNAGSFTITNAALQDILPANVTYVSADPPPNSIVGDILQWNLGDVPGNSGQQFIHITVNIPVTVTHGSWLTNTVEVYADQPDTHPGNNGYTYMLMVRDDVDLEINKFGVGQPAVGEHYEYYLDVANWGGAPADNSVVTDTLPAEVTYLSANPPPDSIVGDTLVWNMGTLAGNQWAGQIKVTAEIINTGTVVNTAVINFPGLDVDYGNNTDDHSENVDDILPPVITQPTQGTTDATPTFMGFAPSEAVVDLYDITSGSDWLISTTATVSGTFSVEFGALGEGSYIVAATASKAGLVSDYSNTATINVNHSLPLDSDFVRVSSDDVTVSAGVVRANRNTLAFRMLDIEARLSCSVTPIDIHLEVTENALFTYDVPPTGVTSLGGNDWLTEFRLWLAEPHSTYDIWLEWDCDGTVHHELLLFILIDPDGFVYDQTLVDAGSPITDSLIYNAVITAYVKIDDTWEVWPANYYGQYNPQYSDGVTDDGVMTPGYYSFLTPSGQYRIEATAPGYVPYQSEVLTVVDVPVHNDVGLQPITGGGGSTQSPVNLGDSGKWADADEAWVGDTISYEIWLGNSGESSTEMIYLTDVIPDHTAYTTGSLSWDHGDAGYDDVADSIWWEGSLAGGEAVYLVYEVTVDSTTGSPFDVVNTTQVDGDNLADLFSVPGLTAVTTIQNIVGIDLQADASATATSGETVIYQHTISNTGNLTDTFTFSAVSSAGWAVTVPSPVELSAGSAVTVQVTIAVPEGVLSAVDETVVTAVSSFGAAFNASVIDKTTVGYEIYLPVILKTP